MILEDFHMHTCFCDGKNSPEEMVLAAISKGMTKLGFSVHSYTPFETTYCIKKEKQAEYAACILSLKEKYKDKISIFLGVEQDYYADEPAFEPDYRIGSVHYLKIKNQFFPVDENAVLLKKAADFGFGGDMYALCEAYFATVSDVVKKTKADIIGHFDLISKFNDVSPLFDENNPRYIAAANKAIDALIPFNKPFELNTGAISKGYKKMPYPNPKLLKRILDKGGKLILSSDAHECGTLCFQFDKWGNFVSNLGYTVSKFEL